MIGLVLAVGAGAAGIGFWMRQDTSSGASQTLPLKALDASGSPAPPTAQTGVALPPPSAAVPSKTAGRSSNAARVATSTAAASVPVATPAASRSSTPKPRTASPTPRRTATSAPAPLPAPAPGGTCTKPVFTTSATSGGWSTAGYYVHNNMWNVAEAGPETLYACSYDNWYVITNQKNSPSNLGSVKTYPNVHKDYNGERISSFSRITSTFAATSPHLGIYDVAYDIWLNGVASSNSTEIMIWTDNYRQVPSGDVVAKVAFGGIDYAVWKVPDSTYVAFVPSKPMTSGNLDLLQMFKWLMSKGWLAGTSTMGQIGFGVEVVDTLSTDARFTFTNFSITDA